VLVIKKMMLYKILIILFLEKVSKRFDFRGASPRCKLSPKAFSCRCNPLPLMQFHTKGKRLKATHGLAEKLFARPAKIGFANLI
jgi:hypothetical protein